MSSPAVTAEIEFHAASRRPEQPMVSVVVPCLNERQFIGRCINSLLTNDYSTENVEILVVDGMSDDGTREILRDLSEANSRVRVINNPRRLISAALNLGIKYSRGDIVLRMDAHSSVSQDYIRQCVDALRQHNADNVGGLRREVPQQDCAFGRCVVACLNTRLGCRGAIYRRGAGAITEVDTVFCGCYERALFEKIGYFNERLMRMEDMEFNRRLRKAGGRILFVPSITCTYFSRSRPGAFLRHNWQNGRWVVRSLRYSSVIPAALGHLVPLAFVLVLLSAIAISPIWRFGYLPLACVVVPYVLSMIFVAASALYRRSVRVFESALMPLVFVALHLSYGLGSLLELAILPFGERPSPFTDIERA